MGETTEREPGPSEQENVAWDALKSAQARQEDLQREIFEAYQRGENPTDLVEQYEAVREEFNTAWDAVKSNLQNIGDRMAADTRPEELG